MVSPGVLRAMPVRTMSRRPTYIFHGTVAEAVSGGVTVSHSSMLTRASLRLAQPTSATPAARSMPRLLRLSRPMLPLMRAVATRPAVFSRASPSSRASTVTLLCSSWPRPTSTTSRPTSAIVSRRPGSESLGCVTRKPYMPRSSGNTSDTRPTLMSMPVAPEAAFTTCCTAQFCTGGT